MKHQVLIGNYLAGAPSGIAFVVDGKAAFVVDTGAPFYAGASAPDGSYHRLQFVKDGCNVRFEWGRVGDCAIGRFRSDKPVRIYLKLRQSWPDIVTEYTMSKAGATGSSAGVAWSLRTSPEPESESPDEIIIDASPDRFTYLVAGISRLPSFQGIDERLASAKSKYEAEKPSASGDWGDFLGAIADNLNNSQVYSTDNHMLAHTVARGWCKTANTAPYFCWDSFFCGNLGALDDPKTSRDTIRAILSCQTPEGLVPNYGHAMFDGIPASNDRSQPPVGSMCIWKMHQRWPDKAFLKEVYPKLAKWHRWWAMARDGNHDGLLEWGSATGTLQGALWETGWDDTVHFDGAAMVGSNLDADAVDLNGLWAMDAQYLALIADEIGLKTEANAYRLEHDALCNLINERLWNPGLGIYCSKLWNGQFLTRLTPMNFYPLIAGAASPEQAKQVLAVMTDPKRFWGPWILPTVTFGDPVWPQQHYWRGKIWGPVNYLVFQGLFAYAAPELMNEFADKSLRLFMRNWEAKGVCGENYLSKDGSQSSDPHYAWGALLCLVGLENIVCLLPDGRLRLNGTLQAHAELRNVPLAGEKYRIVVSPGRTEMFDQKSGEPVAMAKGEVVLERLPVR